MMPIYIDKTFLFVQQFINVCINANDVYGKIFMLNNIMLSKYCKLMSNEQCHLLKAQ